MKDESMTKRQPLEELGELQRRIANLEKLRKKHKKDKDALKKSEGLYRSLFESMLNGFAYCQMHFDEQDKPRDFTYLVVNKSFETLTGLKDIVGKKVSEVIPGIREEDPELLEIYGRVAKSGRPERFEMFVVSLQMWFSLSVYSPERGYFVALFDVITERKLAEENLGRLIERFHLATRAASLGVWDWDVQNNQLVWDDRMYEFYGVERKDFSGAYEAWIKGLHPDDVTRCDEESKRALRGEKEYDTEFRVMWPDGTVRHLKAYGRVVRDSHGKPLRMTGINYDITDRRRVEEALQESESRLRNILESVQTGIVIIDPETHTIVDVNQIAAELIGNPKEKIIGSICHDYICPNEKGKCPVTDIGNTIDNSERVLLSADGTRIPIIKTVVPITMAGRKHLLESFVDITDRKRMEKEILDLSFRDPLTELHNRRGFINLTEQLLKTASRSKRLMLLVFIDIDGMKVINDTLGHAEGDKALIETAKVLKQTFRESDIIARIGGDEFAILAVDSTDMSPETFSKRLQQYIDSCNTEESRQYELAMSWGVATYNPECPMSLDELMSEADKLMYINKKAKTEHIPF